MARTLVGLARGIQAGQGPVAPPACLIAGGETTVTVRGAGSGGRCQEWTLAAALALDGVDGIVALAAGTDGTDGPTEAAGAVADGATRDARARARPSTRGTGWPRTTRIRCSRRWATWWSPARRTPTCWISTCC